MTTNNTPLVQTHASAASIWRIDPPAVEWDSALAALGGHPLQSTLWGEAREKVDGITDQRWLLEIDRKPIWMIRIERRQVPVVGWIGWAPRGPTGELPSDGERFNELGTVLRARGMPLLITDRWRRADTEAANSRPKTVWIDLTEGENGVWEAFDRGFRWSVRRAEKLNVVVEETRDHSRVDEFYDLCRQISIEKRFPLTTSGRLLKQLLARGRATLEAKLFVATVEGQIASGAFVLRCGSNAHYFWGGSNRTLSSVQAGQAVQWAAIKWAISRGCRLYDLEGIDPEGNPGTYAFKKKMGGEEIVLEGKQYFPIGTLGRLLERVDRWRDHDRRGTSLETRRPR